ncbi:MAG: succinate dehydrogenase/fumarate reductase iron-sulfur subunit [Rhodospirillaceae bacterium]|jgi:fumarate reductase iron-sulfur subunit|nr:succinate dehydrogenase/fumarate reductase iron-sulfur subunit [Rhodospirillaceae bacterium]MBT5812285.1 succinate dehydrogenase/fumarate reductase iron-sulfur subunit [Rhodospirillaceae bacterium]
MEPVLSESEHTDTLTVDIWRGGQEDGAFQTYVVPHMESQTVLDVVTYIQRKLDPSLSYRFSCRVGMCGSCAMTVNGKPRWTCRSHVDSVSENGRIQVAPLRNMPVIKDLATDMTVFFDKWQKAKSQFVPTDGDASDFMNVDPASRERKAASAGIECIGCGVCYAACDVVEWNPDYLGPAALNRAWTLVNDARDGDPDGHLRAVATDAGCHACHSHQNCAQYCPSNLNPTASIAGLKRKVFAAALKGRL